MNQDQILKAIRAIVQDEECEEKEVFVNRLLELMN